MLRRLIRYILVLLLATGSVSVGPVFAENSSSKASAAVSGILFDYDGDEFASYVVRDDGFVDITFARNMPDSLYSEILNKLKQHPDIKGVLAGKGGPVCVRF
jgi:hypothetical protein